MRTNKKHPTVKVGLTIHSKRMKELTKGKRWVGSFSLGDKIETTKISP